MTNKDRRITDFAPSGTALTDYDEQHCDVYLRLLDAFAENADWREVARIVLGLDPDREPSRAYEIWESHLKRAEWMTRQGYRLLLENRVEIAKPTHSIAIN